MYWQSKPEHSMQPHMIDTVDQHQIRRVVVVMVEIDMMHIEPVKQHLLEPFSGALWMSL
jgi:hypothetical protein